MSTKLNAEELAAKRHPEWPWRRRIYADAIREVAQPLADEAAEYREVLEWHLDALDLSDTEFFYKHGFSVARVIPRTRAILAKYPKP